jgi:hypothetical protein
MDLWLSRPVTGILTLGLLLATACKAAPEASNADDAPECTAYAAEYERCLESLAPTPEVASRFAESARGSLRVAATDPEARDRLNEKCRAARVQLRETCQ